ncbi:MAG: DUF4358 domain-containing protein [Ruminococcus sp.]|nr:DUF4358 domain-containing protein [Ruminococcus sp.]
MITHILKAICVLCTAACAATAFVGCGDSGSSGSGAESVAGVSQTQFDLSAKEYLDMALEKAPDSLLDESTAKGDTGSYGFDTFCSKLYGGATIDDIADGAISYASTGGNADEVSILKAADEEKQADMTRILKDRVDVRRHDFEGYKPEELPKIDKARVFEANGYSVLVIADNAEEIEKAFKSISEG